MLFGLRTLFAGTFGRFVVALINFYRLQLFGNDDRFGIVCERFAARRLTDMGVFPGAVVEIRLIPTGNFRICVIEFAASEVVKEYRRSGAFKAIVRFE